MRIIKLGTIIPKKVRGGKKKCKSCGCKFEYDKEDLYTGRSFTGQTNYYVKCPQCHQSIFIMKIHD